MQVLPGEMQRSRSPRRARPAPLAAGRQVEVLGQPAPHPRHRPHLHCLPGPRAQQVVQHGGSLSGGASGVLQQPETIVTHPGSAIVTHNASVGLQPGAPQAHPAGLRQQDYLQQQEKRQWY